MWNAQTMRTEKMEHSLHGCEYLEKSIANNWKRKTFPSKGFLRFPKFPFTSRFSALQTTNSSHESHARILPETEDCKITLS